MSTSKKTPAADRHLGGPGSSHQDATKLQDAAERGPAEGTGPRPILVVGTTCDPATPCRWAESLADQLDGGGLVTFNGEGHTAYGNNSCINQVIDDYFLTGATPSADPQCR